MDIGEESVSSTHRLLTELLLVQHFPQRLQDLYAQLLLFVHELLGVFDQPDKAKNGNIREI